MAIEKNEKIQKAEKVIVTLTKEQEEYLEELKEKGRMDHLSALRAARNDGEAEGREENKRETAKNMLKLGAEVEFISKATGLSVEEIEKLREEK